MLPSPASFPSLPSSACGRSRVRIAIFISCLVVAMSALSPALDSAQVPDARKIAAAAQADYAEHVAYIKEHGRAPGDYILDLFDSYDLVVLCERSHPEYTQWLLIDDVIRDRRFGQKVGHLFTEYGSVSAQPALDELMAQPGLTPREIDARVRALMRRMTVWRSLTWRTSTTSNASSTRATGRCRLPDARRSTTPTSRSSGTG